MGISNSRINDSLYARPPLTLVLGEAGSGKTLWAINRASTDKGGGIIVTPSEVEASNLNRSFALQGSAAPTGLAITFGLLVSDLLRNIRDNSAHPINNTVQRWLLTYLLREHVDPSDYLGKMLSVPGFGSSFQRALSEWKRAGATAGLLETLLQASESFPGQIFRHKMLDFIHVLHSYEQCITENKLYDADDSLLSASELIGYSTAMRPPNTGCVIFDGFFHFDYAQLRLISALASSRTKDGSRCEVAVTLPYDGTRPLLFAAPLQSLEQLRSAFTTTEILIGGTTHRMSATADMGRRLYSDDELKVKPGSTHSPGATDCPVYNVDDVHGSVQIYSAPNVYMEVEMVAREFLRLRAAHRYEWHDLGVVVRNLTDYTSVLVSVFERYGIPAASATRLPVIDNPAIGCLLDLINIYTNGWKRTDIHSFLKGGYLSGDVLGADELMTEAARIGIKNTRKQWIDNLDALCAGRPETHATFVWIASVEDRLREPGLSAVSRIQRLLDVVNELDESVRTRGGGYGLHDRAALKVATATLTDLMTLFKLLNSGRIDFELFCDRVRAAWSEARYLVQPAAEAVHIVEPHKTREHCFKAAAVMGLTEHSFPRRVSEDPFLRDGERLYIERNSPIQLEPHTHRADRERFLLYLAATSATDHVLFTHPRSMRDQDVVPSTFLEIVEESCAGTEYLSRSHTSLADAVPTQQMAVTPCEKAIAAAARLFDPQDRDNLSSDQVQDARSTAARSLESMLAPPESSRSICAALTSRTLPNKPELNKSDLRQDLFHPGRVVSVLELNAYRICPFRYLLRFHMGIEPDPHYVYETVKSTVVNEAVRRFYSPGKSATLWQQMYAVLRMLAIDILAEVAFDATPQIIGLLEGRIDKELMACARRECSHASRFGTRPSEFNLAFGVQKRPETPGEKNSTISESALSTSRPLVLNVGEASEILISGVIDRVDSDEEGRSFVIIRSETGIKDYGSIVRGEAIDLPIYMLAAERVFNRAVAAGSTETTGGGGGTRIVRTRHAAAAKYGPVQPFEDDMDVRAVTREAYAEIVQTATHAISRITSNMELADIRATPGRHCRTCNCAQVCRATIADGHDGSPLASTVLRSTPREPY